MLEPAQLDKGVKILVLIGAVNWGIVGIFSLKMMEVCYMYDLINMTFGALHPALTGVVDLLIGLAGLYMIYQWTQD